MPQLFLDAAAIGGSDDLLELMEDGSFDRRLAAATKPPLVGQLAAAVAAAAEALEKQADKAPSSPRPEPSAELIALAGRMADRRAGVPRGTRIVCDQKHELGNIFTGAEACDWLVANCPDLAPGRGRAVVVLGELLDACLVDVASCTAPHPPQLEARDSGVYFYRMRSDAPEPAAGEAMNLHFWWRGPVRPASQVAEELRLRILELYDKHLSPDGRGVSYKKIKTDPKFWEFVDATAELQQVDLTPLTREELMAMFINLYNAAIIHGLVVYGTQQLDTLSARGAFFTKLVRYDIGGCEYSADDMENGVLRGNRPPASALGVLIGVPWLASGPFKADDARLDKLVHPVDARIHFALVCGAKSCPPIKLYSSHNLEEALDGAAESFCQSEVIIDKVRSKVTLSKIFKWYSVDFGRDDKEVLRYVLRFLQPKQREDLEWMLKSGRSLRVSYKGYDWSVNTAD